MSKLSFLGNMGITKLGQIGDSVLTALVNFDPETASQAQIAEYKSRCDDIAHRVAKAQSEVDAAQAKVADLSTKLTRDREAAKLLRDRLATASDKATLTKQAETIIRQMKEIGGDTMDGSASGYLFEAKADVEQAEKDLNEWMDVHHQAVQQLTTAQDTLKHAKDDMERAAREKERARARQAQAEADANLRGGLDVGVGVAVSAMRASADKARQDARAASLQANALHEAKGGDADAIVAHTLTEQKPAADVMDELSKL